MIYEVYIDNDLLYFPNDETYAISNSVLTTALNEAGSFECDVPQHNLRYDALNGTSDGGVLRKKMIRVLKDNVEIFNGEIREVTQNFNFTKHIYAVGELAFLFDSIQPQHRYQGTPAAMFSQMIAYHNSQVENRKKFTVGNVLVTDPNDYVYKYTNREDTLTAIREKLCNSLDGYLRIRKVGNVRYLDLVPLENYGSYCTQEIQFGENLLDYSCNYTASDIATAVIPLGAKLEEEQRTADAIEGLDEYLTIKSVNNGKDFLQNDTAIARFGWVRVVKKWDDITVAQNLKTKAQNWLTSAQFANMELKVNAVDLNLLNSDIESFEVGDTIHTWAEPYGMDTTFPVRKKTIYLNDLSKNYITLSNQEVSKSFTSQSSEAVSALKEEIPEMSPVLQQARDRALAMLLDETQGGYVVYEYDSTNSYVTAINICNARTIDASTSRWRWSQNGLGFMKRSNISQPWPTSNIPIALTSDGNINAERILTGVLKLAGSGSTAKLQIYSGSTLIGQWDADGIDIKKGAININNVFKVDNAGKMTCTSADVKGEIKATSGYFGQDDNVGWLVGGTNLHSKNGPTSAADQNTSHNGTYIGTDGLCNIYGGKFININGGELYTNGLVMGTTVAGTNVRGVNVKSNGPYKTYSNGVEISGQTKAFSIPNVYIDGAMRTVGFAFTNGILTNVTY